MEGSRLKLETICSGLRIIKAGYERAGEDFNIVFAEEEYGKGQHKIDVSFCRLLSEAIELLNQYKTRTLTEQEMVDHKEKEPHGRSKIMDKEIKNARITNVSITMEDHGCLTFWVTLDSGGWGCGFGGYCIGHGAMEYKPEEFSATGSGLVAMMRIMDTVGVRNWEDLVGKYVRCKVGRSGESIDEIGNIIKDKWFNIREYFASVKESKEEKDG